jgi:hypothetical protein
MIILHLIITDFLHTKCLIFHLLSPLFSCPLDLLPTISHACILFRGSQVVSWCSFFNWAHQMHSPSHPDPHQFSLTCTASATPTRISICFPRAEGGGEQAAKPIQAGMQHARLCVVASAVSSCRGGGEQRRLLMVHYHIKVHMDLQADKSPVVVKGPFFPRVVNPRYRICETICNARIQSSKARKAIL